MAEWAGTGSFAWVGFACALLLAGCLGGATDGAPGGAGDETGTGGIDVTQRPAPPETPVDKNLGSIVGQVYNVDNIPIKQANVLLLSTSNFTRTDSEGRFVLLGVTPGTHVLRVDAAKYESLESPVTVVAGEITHVTVRLAYLVDESAGFRDHFHDLWGTDLAKTLFDGPVEFPWGPATGGADVPPSWPSCGSGTTATTATAATTEGAASDAQAATAAPAGECYEFPLKLETGKLVYPGTKELRFTITWTPNAYVPTVIMRTFNATAMTGGLKSVDSSFSAHPFHDVEVVSGTTGTLYLNDTQSQDNGHARFTAWNFLLNVRSYVAGQPFQSGDLIRSNCGTFNVKIEAIKGVVPPDRPHPHFWQNGSKIVVPSFEARLQNFGTGETRDPTENDFSFGAAVLLPNPYLVPPGTTRVNVTIRYGSDFPELDALLSKKTAAFRTASKDPRYVGFADLLYPEPSEPLGAGVTKYSFPIDTANVTDTFYQCVEIVFGGMKDTKCKSFWLILLAIDGEEDAPTMANECGWGCGKGSPWGTRFTFDVELLNENWAEDLKAGRI